MCLKDSASVHIYSDSGRSIAWEEGFKGTVHNGARVAPGHSSSSSSSSHAGGRWESCYLLLEWSATPSARPINICRYARRRGREGRVRALPAAAILISHLSSTTIKFKMSEGGNRASLLLAVYLPFLLILVAAVL